MPTLIKTGENKFIVAEHISSFTILLSPMREVIELISYDPPDEGGIQNPNVISGEPKFKFIVHLYSGRDCEVDNDEGVEALSKYFGL